MTRLNSKVIMTTGVAAFATVHAAIRQVGRTWGATDEEARQRLPGDDLVPDIDFQVTMAIDIAVPPEAVWPWLLQMGVDRAGLYTHTWVENGLLHLKVRNADEIVPGWQDLKVGDHIWFVPEGYPTPRYGPQVAMMEPNRSLVCILGDEPATCLGTWQFILQPLDRTMTRLLFRSRASVNRAVGTKLFDLVVEPAYLYMDIGMLQGIKRRAERAGPTHCMTRLDRHSSTMTVLVAVASYQGSIRHIARAIATTLGAEGIPTDVRDISEVQALTGYDAVILGSPIHRHRWLAEAERFVEHHGADLRARPVWLFSSGMLAIDTNAPWPAEYPQGIADLLTATGAHDPQLFTGRRVTGEPKAFWSLIAKAVTLIGHHRLTMGDFRDWDAIGVWSRDIAVTLQPGTSHVAA